MNFVLCGSMSQQQELAVMQSVLCGLGHQVIAPSWLTAEKKAVIDPLFKNSSTFTEHKRAVTRQYFDDIAHPSVDAVIAVNSATHKGVGYIGPATLSELAVGFHCHKQLFVAYDFYLPYVDELKAFNVQPLFGKLPSFLR
jgi:hypothetical protein